MSEISSNDAEVFLPENCARNNWERHCLHDSPDGLMCCYCGQVWREGDEYKPHGIFHPQRSSSARWRPRTRAVIHHDNSPKDPADA